MKTCFVFPGGFWLDLSWSAIRSLRVWGVMDSKNIDFWSRGGFVTKSMIKARSRVYFVPSQFRFNVDREGTSWRILKIGGTPQQVVEICSDYDCTGKTFCKHVDSYLGGFITVGYYGIDY